MGVYLQNYGVVCHIKVGFIFFMILFYHVDDLGKS